MGGLIGGEARKLAVRREHGQAVCGTVMSRAITHAMAVLEVNSSMGLIVAAPTAGSSGIVPGLLLALQEEYGLTDDQLIDALYNAGAVGYLAMRNATVAGAVGGCQAEVEICIRDRSRACVSPESSAKSEKLSSITRRMELVLAQSISFLRPSQSM